jgi:translation initiation factor IF-2
MSTESTDKAKKVTVRTLATEINIGHDTLIEFLQKKGYDNIKTIMSKVDGEALDLVMKHFGKERDVTEKRQKKVAAFKEKRAKTRDELTPEELKALPPDQQPPEVQAPAAPAVAPAATPVAAPEPAPVTAAPAAEPAIERQPEAAPEPAEVVTPQAPLVEAQPEPVRQVEEPVAEAAPVVDAPIPAAPVAEAMPAEAVTQASEELTAGAPDMPVGEGEGDHEEGEMEIGPDGLPKKRRRRRKTTTTIATTTDPTDLRVTLPGLKIKGKIDLPELRPRGGRDGGPGVVKKGAPGSTSNPTRLVDKVAGLVMKHDGTGAKKADDDDSGKKRGRKVDQKDVANAVRRTLSGMDEGSSFSGRARARKQRRRDRAEETERRELEATEREGSLIRVTESVTANERANLMGTDVGQVIAKCIQLGMMVSINQRLDKDTIQLVADEFGFQVDFQTEFTTDALEDTEDAPETLKPRPPVVTIMGHVDHGKTSLLDYIRRANVVAGESGGITQHIGAYEVTLPDGRQIAFLDTPGHEAFTAMRARGAQVTDVAIIVIAADDSVMPQTWEAIAHAQAAGVPIVFAFNKVDRPDANPERLRQQLSERNILVEEWGGKYGTVELSAKQGTNVDKLLERILLEADILDLKANPDRSARGIVIEAEVDKGRGTQATVLVQKGTLKMGDPFIAGIHSGRVRAMFDERGHRVESAGPSTPVQILGFDGIPQAGDQFIAMESDSQAKEIATKRQQLKREQDFKQVKFITLDDISAQIRQGGVQHLRLILKGDVDGSVEALADSLLRLSTNEVIVEIVHRAVGAISENDVRLAAASGAIILGFHVRPNLDARRLAQAEHVEIRLYSVIYDTINEVRDALEGLLVPEKKEEVTATVEVRETFKVPKIGTIAGCYVLDGKIIRNNKVRLLRDGVEIFTGGLSSLKRFKDDVREVDAGYECGIGLENFNDVKTGDIIEAFKIVEVKRTLEKAAAAAAAREH